MSTFNTVNMPNAMSATRTANTAQPSLGRMIWRSFVTELKLFLREPFAVFFTLAFPVLLLIVFGSAYGHYGDESGFRFIDIYIPAIMAAVMANVGIMGLTITLAEYRSMGVMRRFIMTPLPTWVLLLAHALVGLLMIAAACGLMLIVGALVFNIRFGGNALTMLAAGTLCAVASLAAGFALGGALPSVRTAQAVGAGLFFVMFFISGAAAPRDEFPAWLKTLSEFSPLTHVVTMMTGLWIGKPITDFPLAIAILLGVIVVAALVARRVFRRAALA